MYTLKFSKQAIKTLRKLPRNIAQNIIVKIDELAEDPFAHTQVKVLQNTQGLRLRVGNWRVVFYIDEKYREILIIRISSRGGVYKH